MSFINYRLERLRRDGKAFQLCLILCNGVATISLNSSEMTNGKLEIKGGFEQINTSYTAWGNSFTLILSGTEDQTLRGMTALDNADNYQVMINNSNSRSIIVQDGLAASNTTIDGTTLHIVCQAPGTDYASIHLTKLNGEKLMIDGECRLDYLNYKGKEIIINGDAVLSNEITLSKAVMTIDGDVLMEALLQSNGSTINISGNLTQYGALGFSNRNDRLNIGGDYALSGIGESIQSGVIDVKGDIFTSWSDATNKNGFYGTSKLILSGENDVTIHPDFCHFNVIEMLNSDKRTLEIGGVGEFVAEELDCGDKPLHIKTNSGKMTFIEGVICSDLTISGDCEINAKFCCKSVVAEGNLTLVTERAFDDIGNDLNGCSFEVKGTLTQIGETYLNGAVVKAENYELTEFAPTLHMTRGQIYVSGDMYFDNSPLIMENDKDLIEVAGNLERVRNEDYNEKITAGTIKCGGDMTISGKYPFPMSGTAKYILTGKKDQTIALTGEAAQLMIENAADRTITLAGDVGAKEIAADSDTVKIISDGEILQNTKLELSRKVQPENIQNL